MLWRPAINRRKWFFFAQVVRRFSKNSFRHSIAVRCDATADGGGFTFLPLDEPVMSQPSANHWSLFAFISQRTWADFECHAFACQREADAIHLVRLFTKMAANKNRGSENQPPENDCCNCDRCDCDGWHFFYFKRPAQAKLNSLSIREIWHFFKMTSCKSRFKFEWNVECGASENVCVGIALVLSIFINWTTN